MASGLDPNATFDVILPEDDGKDASDPTRSVFVCKLPIPSVLASIQDDAFTAIFPTGQAKPGFREQKRTKAKAKPMRAQIAQGTTKLRLFKACVVEIRNYQVNGSNLTWPVNGTDAERTKALNYVRVEHIEHVVSEIDARTLPSEDDRRD